MARRSKADRKKAIDDLPDIPGGPWWRSLGPLGPAIPAVPRAAKELAKFMIDNEESIARAATAADDRAYLALAMETLSGAIPQAPGEPLVRTEVVDQKPRKKRKVSDYSKQFGIILKALKKKHPRTPVTRLMKRAHIATRKKMPKKKAPGKGRLSKGRRTIAKSGQFRRDKILPRKR